MNHIIAESFYQYLSPRRCSPQSINLIRIQVTDFLRFFTRPLADFKPIDLYNWEMFLRGKGLKETTIRNKLYLVNKFLIYCQEKNIIPKMEIPKRRFTRIVNEVKFLSQIQLYQLRVAAQDDLLIATIIEVLFDTGIRVSELVAIKVEDIDFERKLLVIPVGKGNKPGIVRFSQRCKIYLERYLEARKSDSAYLFVSRKNKPYSRNTILKRLNKYGKIAGIPFNVGPCTLRKTCATCLAARGATDKFIMRHLRHRHRYSLHVYIANRIRAQEAFPKL